MDKSLIVKIIGKENYIILDNNFMNLLDICKNIRHCITLNIPISSKDYFITKLSKLYESNDVLLSELKSSDDLLAYTNTRTYLIKLLSKISVNINNLTKALRDYTLSKIIYYNNLMFDYILIN